MRAQSADASQLRRVTAWHLVAVVGTSVAFQSLFLHHGISWLFDEGWPLYAAMQLHGGGVLYGDVLFPFPPGHLVSAWLAYGIDPPGIIAARILYAAFTVALCASFYLLARRVTRPPWALLAALLLAVAAPRSHLSHLLFGYRYLVFSVLALLLFDGRLRARGDREARRAMLASGLLAGVALFFRLTPAFAVSCGIALAVATASRRPRDWLRDWVWYAVGIAVVIAPVLLWLGADVGLATVWREVVSRIVALQSAQSLPSPPLSLLPQSGDRRDVYRWFVGLQYRGYIVLYAAYAVGLGVAWLRARRERRPFEHALLVALVVWGAVYLLRALGRSDDHHLMSALPPACLVLGHALGQAVDRGLDALRVAGRSRSAATAGVCALVWVAWLYAMRVDVYLPVERRGVFPLASTGGEVSVTTRGRAARVDGVVRAIAETTAPEDVVLDLTGAPLFHVLTGRRGPGKLDVVTPGIFLSAQEEAAFVERLRQAPPAAVLWTAQAFDKREDRRLERTAPQVARWVQQEYRESVRIDHYRLLVPR